MVSCHSHKILLIKPGEKKNLFVSMKKKLTMIMVVKTANVLKPQNCNG